MSDWGIDCDVSVTVEDPRQQTDIPMTQPALQEMLEAQLQGSIDPFKTSVWCGYLPGGTEPHCAPIRLTHFSAEDVDSFFFFLLKQPSMFFDSIKKILTVLTSDGCHKNSHDPHCHNSNGTVHVVCYLIVSLRIIFEMLVFHH